MKRKQKRRKRRSAVSRSGHRRGITGHQSPSKLSARRHKKKAHRRNAPSLSRSRAAIRSWVTRRKREATEFKRRSKAAKKGWRRRKAREEIERRAKAPPGAKKGRLKEWVVNFSYEGKQESRTIDFTVIARSEQDSITYVYKAVSEGRDSKEYDLVWMERIPWDEVSATEIAKEEANRLDAKEIKALSEGWVEKH